ncbi:MAG TPA: isoleucine--tRNA ligase [Acidimicrobiia bacterium]|nr:isoleucine--tRNA ligase [Acidimicrobiia bacterium]
MTSRDFRRVAASVSFPALEEEVLALWDRVDAFAMSVEMRPPDSEYTFYDGPPFASGSPHYGHILAGVIKDIVPRYWTMRGHRIERRFGWDTHGLPVEMEVEKELGVSGPKAIEAYGVARFNEACRAKVERTTEDWERIMRRLGRWVDFENDYKTMDPDFMESEWWVFSQLWDKGLIYRDFKVVPYSWGAATPLSNFEANMDYRDVDDPAITVRLRALESYGPVREGDYFLIWTTTPWTLPGNLAIAVGEEIEYVAAKVDDHRYWIAEALVGGFWTDGPEVVARAPGAQLIGARYEPPFAYFEEERGRGAFRVIGSAEVTMDEGTGLVHMAPAYGEVDFYALQAAGLDVLVDPVDAEARFTDEVADVAGMHIKDADPILIDLLKRRGLLVRREQIRHSYPFCPRTGTPLIYKAIPTWFVEVEQLRDRMVELNERIHWVPEYVGTRRFGNWLENARDWAISRNRYWGNTIPVWLCDTCDEQVCVGSVDDLEQRSGVRLADLHKHIVDEVTFPCPSCEGTMLRTPEVLDTWFDSGSMPYAQIHYPFENRERFQRRFPADFIAEGLDQTRGWFYTLLILGTALSDQEPFQNCVVNGMILAEDGRKMSKSLKNYPDPTAVLDQFGADALRAYLINSPVLRAEPLIFSENGVREVVRTVMLPLWNSFSFFTTYAEADGISRADLEVAPPAHERPEIDRWILSMLQSLISEVNLLMEGYYLYSVVPPMIGFIDHLTNWYIRRSRRRFWRTRSDDDSDKIAAFATLYEVLVTFSKVIAPVLPFVTEELYQRLVVDHRLDAMAGPLSVHHADYPEPRPDLISSELEKAMRWVRQVVTLGRSLRVAHGLKVRQPLPSLTVLTRDLEVAQAVTAHAWLITEELNVKEVLVGRDETELIDLHVKANFKSLGPRLGADVQMVATALGQLDGKSVQTLLEGAAIVVAGHEIGSDDVIMQRDPRAGMVVAAEGPLSVAIDTTVTPELEIEGTARELINRIQQIRRESGLDVTDRIEVSWSSESDRIAAAFEVHAGVIAAEVLAVIISRGAETDGTAIEIDGESVSIAISRADLT